MGYKFCSTFCLHFQLIMWYNQLWYILSKIICDTLQNTYIVAVLQIATSYKNICDIR